MNNLERNLKNSDGTEEKIVASSSDNYDLNMKETYTLANRKGFKQNKLGEKFKNSALGTDIGIHSQGFTSVAILATVIAIGALAIMYFFWKF